MRQPPLNVVTGSAIIFFEKPTFSIISATSSLVELQAWMRLCEVTGERSTRVEARRPSRGRVDGVSATSRHCDAVAATASTQG